MVPRLHRAVAPALAGLLALVGCRGERPGASADSVGHLVDSLAPVVEGTVGLPFKTPPRYAIRSRAEVGAYLAAKLDEELPPARLGALRDVYRLLGLVSDTLDLKPLLVSLYQEQVAGFFDPDSSTLFVLAGSDVASPQFKFVLAHEMVHALQSNYLPLDSIMHQRWDTDRLAAAQAVLEGQATLASMQMMAPEQDMLGDDAIWETFREQLTTARGSMAVFAQTPRIIQEGLIFPYLAGAEFVRWYERSYPDSGPPYGHAVPVSTEQVLHPLRYAAHDDPVTVVVDTAGAGPGESDVIGDLGIAVLGAELGHVEVVSTTVPIGWGGDRYRLYQTPGGPALVWLIAWDDQRAADRFLAGAGARLAALPRAGYRTTVVQQVVSGHPGVRVVIAPVRWLGWGRLPS